MHNIPSPNTADSAIEQELQAKGLTAPRVTPKDLEDSIYVEHFFTAEQGVRQAISDNEGFEPRADQIPGKQALGLLTICVLVLRNGFTVTGESACASPENFDADIGHKIARDKAIDKVWPLLGYALVDRLHAAQQLAA